MISVRENVDPKKYSVFLRKTTKPTVKIDQTQVNNDQVLLGEISEQTKANICTKYLHTFKELLLPHPISCKPENIKKT